MYQAYKKIEEMISFQACRREVVSIKEVWDLVNLVQTSFSDWKTTLWTDINVEQMDIDSKRFAKVLCV